MQAPDLKEKIKVAMKATKKEMCRFYLRGLCIQKASECHNSHGVWDLHYESWVEGETIIYDFSKIDNTCKDLVFKGKRIYYNLYDYQPEKIFTLQELNEDRAKRQIIRNQMHCQMFNEFMDLLCCYYPDTFFTEEFLLREFTRVGFNKTMSVIKLSHICSYVCDPPGSRFFKTSFLMPPLATKQTPYVLLSCPDEQNLAFYRSCYEDYAQIATPEELTQSSIKKYLFSVVRSKINLFPLNLYLKNKKMNFVTFLKTITNQSNQMIVLQVDQKMLLESSIKFIHNRIQQEGWCSWQQVFKFLNQQYKLNNANLTNPLKPILIDQGFLFLNFPMLQLITNKKRMDEWKIQQLGEHSSVCQCSYKSMYPEEELLINLLNIQQLTPKQSYDIVDMQSLLKCAGTLLHSKIIAVDLQGRLRKGGYIEMIQINTGMNTFLIDIYGILKNGDMQTFELCKKILRNLFCDRLKLKIFHDCRHDSLVLHQIMNTCIINVFDTSAVQTLIGQMDYYRNGKNSKDILKTVSNVKTPGINELLKKYHAPHGINKNKEWFHELWRKGHTELFQTRPLDPEYRDYCIKDVLDLPYIQIKMIQNLQQNFTNWLSSHYIGQGYLYTVDP